MIRAWSATLGPGAARGRDVTQWPVPQRIAAGIAIVPENRRLFGQLTVRENLELGAVLRKAESLSEDFDKIRLLFPAPTRAARPAGGHAVRRRDSRWWRWAGP